MNTGRNETTMITVIFDVIPANGRKREYLEHAALEG